MKQCPHCQRNFKKHAADRHIPMCANTKARPKPPPTKQELKEKIALRRSMHLRGSPRQKMMDSKQEEASPTIEKAAERKPYKVDSSKQESDKIENPQPKPQEPIKPLKAF